MCQVSSNSDNFSTQWAYDLCFGPLSSLGGRMFALFSSKFMCCYVIAIVCAPLWFASVLNVFFSFCDARYRRGRGSSCGIYWRRTGLSYITQDQGKTRTQASHSKSLQLFSICMIYHLKFSKQKSIFVRYYYYYYYYY